MVGGQNKRRACLDDCLRAPPAQVAAEVAAELAAEVAGAGGGRPATWQQQFVERLDQREGLVAEQPRLRVVRAPWWALEPAPST